jgi:hypothetical protein
MGWLKVARASVGLTLAAALCAVGGAGTAAADTPAGPPFTQCAPVGYDSSCSILLDVNTDNSVSVLTDPSVGPFDGADDTLVGIVNNSTTPVTAVTVTGPGTDLSGFDYDGLCNANYYGHGSPLGCPFGPTGYEGPGTSLVTAPSLPDEAEVDFSPALQTGQSAYFSLEGALEYAQLTARQGSLQGAVIHYVAMGDSFSSGESNPPYQTVSSIEPVPSSPYNSKADGCHRSDAAYPELLASDLPFDVGAASVNLQFIACSGATTDQMLGQTKADKGSHNELPQVDQLQDIEASWAQSPDLVTWTGAGDDVGFANIVKRCVYESLGMAGPPFKNDIPIWNDGQCAHDKSFVNGITNTINGIEGGLQQNYARLASYVGTDTSVMVADYPQIFPANKAAQDCIQLSPYLSEDDQNLFRQWTVALDLNISKAVRADGLNFVNVLSQFNTHAICDNGGADFNALTNVNGWNNVTGSFHPNVSGQADYAQAFEDYITNAIANGSPRTSAGLPSDPGPPATNGGGGGVVANAAALTVTPAAVGDQSTAPDTSGDTLTAADLAIATAAPQTDSCPDVYQPGQVLTFTGDGYAPGATVTVTLMPHSPEALTDTVVADQDGQITDTMRLPLGLVGARAQGTNGIMAYIEADGTGATSTVHLDNALVNLAPHGSTCGQVDSLPFDGFNPPVRNAPTINDEHPGRTLPVKFDLPGVPGTLNDALWPGYPQSTPVDCNTLAPTGPATATNPTGSGSQGSDNDHYNYLWSTDSTWTGCRELDVRLADGTDHTAYFSFGGG